MEIVARPLTPDRIPDLETLFAAKGCSFARGCWCMGYRISGRLVPEAGRTVADEMRARMIERTGRAPAPGLLGYDGGGAPVGWVSVAPRSDYARLARSPIMRPVDDRPVWSIVCFVVDGRMRGRGVARAMLDHAVDHARSHGAEAVEGYPVDRPGPSAPQFLWHGARSMFDAAGFAEIARRKPTRPVMRLPRAPWRPHRAAPWRGGRRGSDPRDGCRGLG